MSAPLLDGRYTLLEQLGQGGEAEVWRARDSEIGTEVAVRLPHQPILSSIKWSVPAEHPAWVPYFRSGLDAQRGLYQVFQLLSGSTLRELISSQLLPWRDWLDFLEQSMAAVAALHQGGWVHGDLQESNLLYEQKTKRWVLLELPFLSFPAPARSPLFGSLPVLAPELFQGQVRTFQSDLYALGCLYHCSLIGAYPHQGTSVEIAAAHLYEPVRRLKDRVPQMTEELDNWIQRLLARQPEDRFLDAQTAHTLLLGCIAPPR